MEKITMDVFKNNRKFIILTIFLGITEMIGLMMKPEYLSMEESIICSIVLLPLNAWWLMAFWNKILTKIFSFKEISYGVAFLLTMAILFF